MNGKVCGAKCRNGEPCKNAGMANGRCRRHGGKTPRGFASPQTKTGRYSKDLPTRLAATYEAGLADENLLALNNEIALVDSLIVDLIKRLDTGESGHVWKKLQKTKQELQRARGKHDGSATVIESELFELIENGVTEYAAIEELGQLLDRRGRLVDRETKRLTAAQQTVTIEQAMLIIAALGQSVRDHVTDADARKAIQADLLRLTAGGTRESDRR